MGIQQPAVHRAILTVDVEGFGDRRRTHPHQIALRDGLYRTLRKACAQPGFSWEACYHEDRGDGVLVLISPDVPKNLLAASLPHELAAGLREHNAANCPEAQIRLRMALHAGEVQYDDNGVVGAAVNLAFRLLDAAAVKSALAGSPGVLALVASEWFFDEVIRHDPTSNPATYRQVQVAVKEIQTTAWVCLPDYPYPPRDEETGDAEAESQRDAPYLGLAAFQPDDADRFFGREQLISELVTRLASTPFLAVFGASGSGKSSLLRAGLLPAVRAGRLAASQDWPTVLLTPGAHPLEELAIQVAALHGISPGSLHTDLLANPASLDLAIRQAVATRSPGAQVLLIVDQFEEVFTLCPDERERAGFVAALLGAVAESRSRARVVLGIRADFYARCADYPALVSALRDAQVLIGPMNSNELRGVIVQPAARAGLSVEPALVDTIVGDVAGRPGALPLLSHALLETWQRRQGRTLTLAGYQATGGVQGAIGQTAEQVYGQLSPDQQGIAKSVFLRLTALGEATEDTRRRVHRAELLAGPDDSSGQRVLDRLVQARLVTLGTDTVEVTHEALIREWPRLRQWLTDDRDGLHLHRRLTEAATEWEDNEREEGFLYRGARLAAWQDRPLAELNTLERAFLEASHQRKARERAASRRRVRLAVSGLSLALVVITVLALMTALQRNQARDQRDLALSRQLATSAAAQLSIDPELSLLLARQAFALRPIPEAEAVLRQATVDSRVRATFRSHDGPVVDVAFSPNGQRMASAGRDGTVRIWDPTGRDQPVVLRSHDGPVRGLAFSPDGQRLTSASDDNTVRIWNPMSGADPVVLRGHAAAVRGVAFSPDGQRLASTSNDATVRIWDPASGTEVAVLHDHDGVVNSVAFSPDGRHVASAGDDETVRIWEPAAGRVAVAVLRGHDGAVYGVAFSPDGRHVASVGDDETVRTWDWSKEQTMLRGHDGSVGGAAFSPDGQRIASGHDDGTVRIWDLVRGGNPIVLSGHKAPVNSVAFSPDGRQLASASADGTVRVWDPASGTEAAMLHSHDDELYAVAFSPDGRRIVSAGAAGAVRVWNPAGRDQPVVLRSDDSPVFGVAFSPDGQRLASATNDGTVRIWNLASGTEATVLRGHEGAVLGVAFSPDGQRLASAGNDGTVRIWDSVSSTEATVLRGHEGPVFRAGVSPDGQRIASAGNDGTVRIWDLRRGGDPVVLRGHQNEVNGAVFSPDGQRVVSASDDGTVRVWQCEACGPIDEVLALAEKRSTRALTSEERKIFLHDQ